MSSTPSALNDELVRAGAGAGKTTALVARVMELIAHYRGQNQKWPRLVVTTFTRKATQELRERLTVEACRRQDLELLDYCRSRSRLHISTIHGVMGLFLRRYGHLLGIDPSYTILTETGAAQMRRQILRQVLMSETAGSDLLEQYRLAALENMLREFADAKAAHPDLRPLTESEILQMQGAAAAKLGHDAKSLAEEIRGATQHETWLKYAQILSQLAKLLQHPWNKENWDLIMSFWDGFPSKPRKGPNTISDDLDENIKTWRENLKKWLDDPGHSPFAGEQLAAQAVKFRHLGEAYATRIREHKMTQGQMEMSDLELLALKTLRDQPSVGQAFSCDWDHWLIDEYQDTSPVQTELLKLLVGGRPRYIVGDPQQSIYLFRGARSEVFAHEEAALRAKGGHTQVKMKNYRSHPSLLCFINDFFAKVSPDFQAMEPRSLEFHPRKAVATFHQATVEDGQGPRQSEYQAMASHIQHLLKNEKAQLSDICVLTRKNRTLLDIAQFLKEQGYPTHVHASRGYSARREVQDALALLKFLAHPADDQNLMALLRSPWCRVRDDQLVKNIKRDRMSYWQQLQNSELKNHPALARLKQSQGEAIELGLSMAWEKALLRFCFFDLSTHHDATGRREANLWKLVANLALAERRPGFKILEFINQATAVQDEDESADEGDAVTAVEPNVINLMTVHAAKGLQRPHVIIPHCDEASKPKQRQAFAFDASSGCWSVAIRGKDEDLLHSPLARSLVVETLQRELKEQDRLLYVAVTRAQESVYFSWTDQPKPNSWAGRWGWSTQHEGVIIQERYQVLVRKQNIPAARYQKTMAGKSHVREPWRAIQLESLSPMVQSVTTLLDKKLSVAPSTNQIELSQNDVTERIEKAVVGTQLHRLLEQMRLNHEQDLSKLAQSWFPNQAEKVLKALVYVRELKTPPMHQLLKCGHPEWGFQIKLKDSILEGQIDLWGQVDNQIWLIDYKSGDPRAIEKAFAQLEIYAYALKRFGHQLPIQLAVIYPFHGRVEVRVCESSFEKKTGLFSE